MAHADFVHLRVHSAYSLLEGAIHVKPLAKLVGKAAQPAVALTDTNNMFGALEFSEIMIDAGIQPITGCTLSLANPMAGADRYGRKPDPDKIVLLAQNKAGYKNLMKLVSKAHLESEAGDGPHIEIADFDGRTDGVIMLTGGVDGPIGRLLQDGQREKAETLLKDIAALFPGRLYMELQRHGLESEKATEENFLELAHAHDLPVVATNDVYFATPDMYEAHDALLCIAGSTYVSSDDRRKLTPEHYFKSAAEMRDLFRDLPEAVNNTLVIAKRCAYRVEKRDPILPNFADGGAAGEAALLRKAVEEGLEKRLQKYVFKETEDAAAREEKAGPYRERLALELDIIIKMGFPGYFLIVADFIQWAKDHRIPVGPGRGSGAGSLVAWSLKITDLDPLRFGLLFERFLNPERVSMPDFDIDFCQDKRDQVIRYVQEKYGRDHVAQIITLGKLQARIVLRDVGRVLGQPYPVTDRICKLIPNNPANPVTLAEAIEGEPRLQYERDSEPLTAKVMDIGLKLEGLYRHASTHAAGVVIGDRALDELVPLYRDPRSDMPVTQFTMKWVEKAGLVKFDFLGLKTLTVIDQACALLANRGIDLDIAAIPLDDARTYEMLSRGDSAGVFQLESSGMRSALKGLKPDSFEDIIALVALYRPGPMDNIPTYVNRKHGQEEIDYLHDWLKPTLEETYGVIIYQEQVMEIAKILAGYSLGEADLLRRAMGKKIKKEMDAQRKRFVDGAAEKGVAEDRATFIFDLVAKFAGYGFNKSHAAAYALVAYQTAYLKANYPVEFMAASMTLDLGNTDKLAGFKKELQHLDIKLLPPDINKSDVVFSVEAYANGAGDRLAIRYALAAIKNVGEKAMEMVVGERRENGPFKEVYDFVSRIDARAINKRQIESLVAAGAFDSLNDNRAQLHEAAEFLVRYGHTMSAARDNNQTNLFGGEENTILKPELPETARWDDGDKLRYEAAALGFFLSAHPLDSYEAILTRRKVVPCAEVLGSLDYAGRTVMLAGAIDRYQERTSQRSGKKYAHLGLSDSSDSFEVTVFSDLLDTVRNLVEKGAPILITAEVGVREGEDSVNLMAKGLYSLDTAAVQTEIGLDIYLDKEEAIATLGAILERYQQGRGKVTLFIPVAETGREAVVGLSGRYKITPQIRNAIAAVPGVIDAREA